LSLDLEDVLGIGVHMRLVFDVAADPDDDQLVDLRLKLFVDGVHLATRDRHVDDEPVGRCLLIGHLRPVDRGLGRAGRFGVGSSASGSDQGGRRENHDSR